MTPKRTLVLLSLLFPWVVGVSYLTLMGAGSTIPLTPATFLCFACGWRGTADIFLNWLLFVPAGFLLAGLWGFRRATLTVVLFTIAIETLQAGIPSRHSSLQDVAFNTLGGATGAWLLTGSFPHRIRRVLPLLAAVGWLAPVGLLVPMGSDAVPYGQWTPRLGGHAPYEGRVLSATAGGVVVGRGALPIQPIMEALEDRREIQVTFIADAPTQAHAPVLAVADSEQRGLLMIGVSGTDLIVRARSPAQVLRLDRPYLTWRGAFEGVAAGDTVTLFIDRSTADGCARLAGERRCGLAPRLSEGWAHLLNLERLNGMPRRVLGLLWAFGLGLLVGWGVERPPTAVFAGLSIGVGGHLASTLSPDVAGDLPALLTITGGAWAAGRCLPWLRRTRAALRPRRS